MRTTLLAGLCAVSLGLAGIAPLSAATLRWANDGDVNSMDPYARNETFLACLRRHRSSTSATSGTVAGSSRAAIAT